jgi:hypothetical protein
MRPTLTVVDCYRILLRNGPTGGNLEDVLLKKTLVASTDPVAIDGQREQTDSAGNCFLRSRPLPALGDGYGLHRVRGVVSDFA